MNEREPQPDGFFITINGEKVLLSGENCTLYLHEFEPHYDHVFIETESNEDEPHRTGYFLWRMTHQAAFDRIVKKLLDMDAYQVDTNGWASDGDKHTFTAQGLVAPEFVEPTPETLTPRQVNLINFMSYLLLHEQLSANDFNGDGDLYI